MMVCTVLLHRTSQKCAWVQLYRIHLNYTDDKLQMCLFQTSQSAAKPPQHSLFSMVLMGNWGQKQKNPFSRDLQAGRILKMPRDGSFPKHLNATFSEDSQIPQRHHLVAFTPGPWVIGTHVTQNDIMQLQPQCNRSRSQAMAPRRVGI